MGGDDTSQMLVASRARRANAGNRMASLLSMADGNDEDFERIFAEDAEDADFEDKDATPSDVDVGSSSDDEDQGPAATGNDLEGEKELQTVERTERQKKRKARGTFKTPKARPRGARDDRKAPAKGPSASFARPKKKEERTSWLPAADGGPIRASTREQTMKNKKEVHQRLQEGEKRREKIIKSLERSAKEKEATKLEAMTQADRLAEAARTERQNSKSLNRWEAAEQKRAEERMSKLAALQNRHLEGPVIGFWSGPSRWMDGRLVAIGAKNILREAGRDGSGGKDPSSKTGATNVPQHSSSHVAQSHDHTMQKSTYPTRPMTGTISTTPIETSTNARHGNSGSRNPDIDQMLSRSEDTIVVLPERDGAPSTSQNPVAASETQKNTSAVLKTDELSTKNLVVLENIDGNALKTPELQNHVLLNRRKGNAKLTSQC